MPARPTERGNLIKGCPWTRSFAARASRDAREWVAAALCLAWACWPAAAAAADRVLAVDHLGGVRLGMTAAQAERALGAALLALQGKRSEACWIGHRRGGTEVGVTYMVEAGKISRIDVVSRGKAGQPSIVTAAGIGIGSTLAAVNRAYPKAVATSQAETDQARWMLVERSPRGGLRLQLDGGKVTALWAARRPAIDYYEGCL